MDANDPGCESGADVDETDPSTECNDEIDNDGDGWIDLDDPVCISISVMLENDGVDPSGPPCNDGIDNDFDGLIDGADPQCLIALDLSEAF